MADRGRLIRFAIVGVSVAAIYVLLYVAFMAAGLPQLVANGAAFLIAVAVQYAGQAGFTFRAPIKDRGQAIRFAAMIGAGLVTSAFITGMIAPAARMPDWLAAATVAVVLPVQNYLIMSRWVFARLQKAEHAG